ncbi:type IV pili methyl-accepting chemotaxis transducer N-terminal domain-containing protein [Yoonia sp. 2307UL14-13]|uniref:type IV pili methyl-accepting chemotaxis transducer N-terminal domain-containing protein n=1 Tax=Yoonia sp. 2307UL14-13 TaxID=3126506 RepID=UPI0030A074F2
MPNLTILRASMFGLIMTGTAHADTVLTDLSAAGDINVLLHRTAATVCMVAAGADEVAEKEDLALARTRFNTLLDQLADGRLSEETEAVAAAWRDQDVALSMILAGDDPAAYADTITNGRPGLEFAALALMDAASHRYAQLEEVAMNDVVTFDVAGRQEIYVQKMKHLACAAMADDAAVDVFADLTDAVGLYDRSLTALRDGVPAMGIDAPASYAVQQALAAAAFDWQGVKSVLATIAADGVATADDLSTLRIKSTALAAKMSDVVDMYLAPADVKGVPQVASLEVAAQ